MKTQLLKGKAFVFVFLLFLSLTPLWGQKPGKGFALTLGGYLSEIYPGEDLFGPGYQYLVVSPEIGLTYKFGKAPISISYRRNFVYGIFSNHNVAFDPVIGTIGANTNYNEIDQLNIYYHFEAFEQDLRVRAGFFRKQHIDESYYFLLAELGVDDDLLIKGGTVSLGFDFKEVSVEFNKHFAVAPFALFDTYLNTVSVYRYFSLGKKNVDKEEGNEKAKPWDHFFPFISLRLQPIKYHWQTNEDLFNPVGFVPGLGLGYHFPKYDVSLIVSRDVWKRLIGGTYSNDLIGYISTTNVMVKKYFSGAEGKGKWVVGLGWHPIRNDNEPWREGRKLLTDAQGNEIVHTYPRYTNVYGVGYSIGYALDKNYEIEFRQIFPYLGDAPFTFWYSGLGVLYHFR